MTRSSYQDKMRLETKWSEKWTWLISSPPRIALESPLWESGELTIIRRRHWANGSRPESRTQPSRITTLCATDIPVSTGAASPNRTGNRRFVASCDIHFTIAAGWGFWSRTRFIRVRVWDTAVISILNSTANSDFYRFPLVERSSIAGGLGEGRTRFLLSVLVSSFTCFSLQRQTTLSC